MSRINHARPQSRFVLMGLLGLVVSLLLGLLSALPASADTSDNPLGYDPQSGMTWVKQVDDVQFATTDPYNPPGCETSPGRSNGYAQVFLRLANGPHKVQFTGYAEDWPGSRTTYLYDPVESEVTATGGFPIANLTAGTYTGHIEWTDESGKAQEFVWEFSVEVCPSSVGVQGHLKKECAVVGGVNYLKVTAVMGSGDSTSVARFRFDVAPHGEIYTVFDEEVDAGKAVSKSISYPDDGEYEDGILFTVYGNGALLDSGTYKPSECAPTPPAPKQAAPKASVSGTAKVTTSTAPRSVTIVNTDDPTNKANAYKWVLSGPTKASGTTKSLADKASVKLNFNLKPGSYTFTATGSDGKVTIKFTVSKYPAPTFVVTDKAKGKIRVCVSFPSYKLMWEDGNSKGTSFGKNHWTGAKKPGCTTLDTPNVKSGKVNWVRVTVSVSGPDVVRKVKIDRRPHS